MLKLYFNKEEPIEFSNDLIELTKTLENISPEDTQGYFAFLADIYQRYTIAKKPLSRNHFVVFGIFIILNHYGQGSACGHSAMRIRLFLNL